MSAHAYCEDGQLFVSGELDFSTVANVWKESLPLLVPLPHLRFNFSKVTSANSAGLTLLIEWLKYAKQVNKPISFNHLPKQMMSLATMSGIDELLLLPIRECAPHL